MVLTLSKSEVSVVGSVSGSFGKAVLLLFNAFFCPPESLSLSWPGALLRPRSTCGSNWAEFGSHGKMRVSEYFLLDNPDFGDVVTWMPCWPSDLGRFWGAREVKMWGAFMVVGTRTACASLCQEVGEQITLACWRGPCAQGTFPALGNHVHITQRERRE